MRQRKLKVSSLKPPPGYPSPVCAIKRILGAIVVNSGFKMGFFNLFASIISYFLSITNAFIYNLNSALQDSTTPPFSST